MLSQINVVHVPASCFQKINVNIILPCTTGSLYVLFPLEFPAKTLYCIFLVPDMVQAAFESKFS
jgi:hypothetical protein